MEAKSAQHRPQGWTESESRQDGRHGQGQREAGTGTATACFRRLASKVEDSQAENQSQGQISMGREEGA